MSCGCNSTTTAATVVEKPAEATPWTPPVSTYRPAEIQDGENIECFAARSPQAAKESSPPIENKIENSSISSDLSLNVNEQFKLTATSPKTVSAWRIWFDGTPGVPNGMGLVFNTTTGALTGTVAESFANKSYEVEVKAFEMTSDVGINSYLDSKKFTFFPKLAAKEPKGDVLKLVYPIKCDSPKPVVTSGFGPRSRGMHNGVDIAARGNGIILAAADGDVISSGPASGFGNWIRIAHKNSTGKLLGITVYGHMKELYVKVGQKVCAGQPIAKEGNEGIGSGPHLHFEVHLGQWKMGGGVDPMPFLNCTDVPVARASQSPSAPSGPVEQITQSNRGMTMQQVSLKRDCPECSGITSQNSINNNPLSTYPPSLGPTTPALKPETNPDKATTKSEIERAINEDSSLDEEDKKFLLFVAKIESQYNAKAHNKISDAKGVFQMLPHIANHFFKKIGKPSTDDNIYDPYTATKAMLVMYKNGHKRYWDMWLDSGKTKIAGIPVVQNAVTAEYASLNKGEFMYGIVHNNGVGNSAKGINVENGISYYRKKVKEYSFVTT